MSLRFLKAKPKLGLSKNKIRSVQKFEPKISDNSSDASTEKEIKVNNENLEKAVLNTSLKETDELVDINHPHDKKINEKTNQEKRSHDEHSKNDSDSTAKSEENDSISQSKTNISKSTSASNINNSEDYNKIDPLPPDKNITSSNISNKNKFRFLKAKPKIQFNIQSKNRQQNKNENNVKEGGDIDTTSQELIVLGDENKQQIKSINQIIERQHSYPNQTELLRKDKTEEFKSSDLLLEEKTANNNIDSSTKSFSDLPLEKKSQEKQTRIDDNNESLEHVNKNDLAISESLVFSNKVKQNSSFAKNNGLSVTQSNNSKVFVKNKHNENTNARFTSTEIATETAIHNTSTKKPTKSLSAFIKQLELDNKSIEGKQEKRVNSSLQKSPAIYSLEPKCNNSSKSEKLNLMKSDLRVSNIKKENCCVRSEIDPIKNSDQQVHIPSSCDKDNEIDNLKNNTTILSKDNIDSVPIILVNDSKQYDSVLNPSVSSYVFTDDHMYAKPYAENKKEKSTNKRKNKNGPKLLNSFQKALLLQNHEDEKSDYDKNSESDMSESETYIPGDVNIRTINEGNVNEISFFFSDKELEDFSGLSLITKIIKEENYDPADDYDSCRPLPPHLNKQNTFNDLSTSLPSNCNKQVFFEDSFKTVSSCYNNQYVFEHESKLEPCEESIVTDHIVAIDSDLETNTQEEELPKSRKKQKKVTFGVVDEGKDCSLSKKSGKKSNQNKDLDYVPPPPVKDYESSGSEITDIDEQEYLMYRKKVLSKRKNSENIFSKRQSETLKKIRTESSWKENLTVNDLMFYNPTNNPMMNPPEVNKVKEIVLDKMEDEEDDEVDNPAPVPQLKIVNGKLVLDDKSLTIEETGLKKSKKKLEQSQAVIESTNTVRKVFKKKHGGSVEWSAEDTLMFYRALNVIGTDFTMMATMFQNRNRASIKRKFKQEEKKNPSLILKAMTNFKDFDVDELKLELISDKKRAEKIKAKEKKKIRKEKEIKRRYKKSPRVRSVYGKLVCDVSTSRVPEYKEPHEEVLKAFQKIQQDDSR